MEGIWFPGFEFLKDSFFYVFPLEGFGQDEVRRANMYLHAHVAAHP